MEFKFLTILFQYFPSLIFFAVPLLLFSILPTYQQLKRQLLCRCEVCKTYLSSNWSKDYDNLADWYTHLLRNSPTQTIHIHVLGNTITANPDNVEHILKTRFANYPKGRPFSTILGDLLGKGIFNVDGDLWLFQRKIASLELASFSIRSFAFDIVVSEISTRLFPLFASSVGTGGIIDLQDVFRRFTFDNICKFLFGLDPACLESSLPISSFAESFDVASKLSAARAMATLPFVWKIKKLLNIGTEKKLKEAIRVINNLANKVITMKRKLGFSTNQDLLSRFMATIDDDKYLRDIVISFVMAGRDATASALTTCLWLLTKNPHVAARIREEASLVMSPGQELASYDQVREMHYLHATIYESLRLYPPIQFDSKFAKNNDILPDGTIIAPGTRVTYHNYAMGRMEKLWGFDCMEFKPERWLLENGAFNPISPFKYPIFQGGIRVCLGKELSLVEMKLVVLSIIQKFEINVIGPKGSLRFDPGLTATVRGGFQAILKERTRINI